jgi:hypothetical protein
MMSLPQSQVQEALLELPQLQEQVRQQELLLQSQQLLLETLVRQHQKALELHQLEMARLQIQVDGLKQEQKRQVERFTLLEKFTLKLSEDVLELMGLVKQYIQQNMRV